MPNVRGEEVGLRAQRPLLAAPHEIILWRSRRLSDLYPWPRLRRGPELSTWPMEPPQMMVGEDVDMKEIEFEVTG